MRGVEEIKTRLSKVATSNPWKFNPAYEMFIGTTAGIEMNDRFVDLGRTSLTYVRQRDDDGKFTYVPDPESVRHREATHAIGNFIENSREDITYLLSEIDNLQREVARLRMNLHLTWV